MNLPYCAADWHTLGTLVDDLYHAFCTRHRPDIAAALVAIVIHHCFLPDEWEA